MVSFSAEVTPLLFGQQLDALQAGLTAISDPLVGVLGYQDAAFSITKAQAPSKFKAFLAVANGAPVNAFQSITINGTVIASTNLNFLATAGSDNVGFSGWGLRGGAGTAPLVVANFGAWFENNSNIVWVQEFDVNNEGATQSEGSDSGGVGLAINTGSTYSPDTAIWVRRATGAGSGPGFLRGITIEGARNVGLRIMAMDATTYPTLTPAAPGTVTALAFGKSSDAQYRFTVNESGVISWGAGAASVADTTLQRTAANKLTMSGSFVATLFFVGANQVVGARAAGWTSGTGTPNVGAFAAYAGATMSVGYVQAEAQATNDAAKAASQRALAIEAAMRTHGLIS